MDISRIIQEIESDENKRRKAEHAKRHDVYNDYQREHVLAALSREFSEATVREMRTFTSINLSRKIVDEMATVYKKEPERNLEGASEQQEKGVLNIYDECRINVALKRANQKYKLHDQCAIQVIPKEGKFYFRVLSPHQYDVIPDPLFPERAKAVIISTYDRWLLDTQIKGHTDLDGQEYGSKNTQTNLTEQKAIATETDYRKAPKTYVVWTKDEVVTASESGGIIERVPNPIGMLPFVDVACNKDFEFWVRRGSGITEFSLDFSLVVSDTVNTNRLQSYSQPVITAEKLPESVTVGPNHILFLPLDPTRPEVKPSFEFASPNPDLKSSLDLQDRLINYFLSSRGIDTKSIATSGNATQYASGLERLLAMVEKYDASQDDLDLFWDIEQQIYKIIGAWYEQINGTVGPDGSPALDPSLSFGPWPTNAKLQVQFAGPELVQTESEKIDTVVKKLEAGLISKVDAVSYLRGVTKEMAEEIIEKINEETDPPALPAPTPFPVDNSVDQKQGEDENGSNA